MWEARRRIIRDDWGEEITLFAQDRALTVAEAIAGWRDDEAFRGFFIGELAATAWPAFFWEMPPVKRNALEKPFECAVIRGDALAWMRAGGRDFAQHLHATAEPVAAFPNLGGDALLIAPRKLSDASCYGHLAAFLRGAPRAQQHALFQLLANETERMLQPGRRFWISTSGLGVPWVHIRLDSWPKYYQYRRYAEG